MTSIARSRVEVGEKTNEIPEIKRLLEPMNIAGRVVTADAMHTQRETARYIVEEKKAHYLFTVKDNQKTLHAEIAALGNEGFSPVHKTMDKGHGRIEVRTIQTSTALNTDLNFPYCGQVFRLTRERFHIVSRKREIETVYGITSLTPQEASQERLLRFYPVKRASSYHNLSHHQKN